MEEGGGSSLRKALNVIGLPVIQTLTGEEVGKVQDVLFNQQWFFQGIVLETNGWFKKGRFIPSDKISAVGLDAIMIDNVQFIQSLEHTSHLFGLVTGNPKIKGMTVLTQNGHQLGQVEDVYFMEEMGTLVGYELSDGFISDLREGRKLLKRPTHTTLGENALIVPVSSEEDVGEIVQGE